MAADTDRLEYASVLAEQVSALAAMLMQKLQGEDAQTVTLINVLREKAEEIEKLIDAAILPGRVEDVSFIGRRARGNGGRKSRQT